MNRYGVLAQLKIQSEIFWSRCWISIRMRVLMVLMVLINPLIYKIIIMQSSMQYSVKPAYDFTHA